MSSDLAIARFEKAMDDYDMAKALQDLGKYRGVMNRSYYAVFHAIRAVNALDGFDSKKHSGVIAHFQQSYVKTKEFDTETSYIIEELKEVRNASDYDDFYVVSQEEALEQFKNAKIFLDKVKDYLISKGVFSPQSK